MIGFYPFWKIEHTTGVGVFTHPFFLSNYVTT